MMMISSPCNINCVPTFYCTLGVVREMETMSDALGALTCSGKTAFADATKMVYQSFLTQQTAPQEPNRCIAVDIWSRNQMLVAYAQDCTL